MERRSRLTSDPAKARAWRARSARPLGRKPPRRLPDPIGPRRCVAEGLAPGRCFPGPMEGLHRHHLVRRSQGGPDDPENLIWLCPLHHGWVHDHPALAREWGLLR